MYEEKRQENRFILIDPEWIRLALALVPGALPSGSVYEIACYGPLGDRINVSADVREERTFSLADFPKRIVSICADTYYDPAV